MNIIISKGKNMISDKKLYKTIESSKGKRTSKEYKKPCQFRSNYSIYYAKQQPKTQSYTGIINAEAENLDRRQYYDVCLLSHMMDSLLIGTNLYYISQKEFSLLKQLKNDFESSMLTKKSLSNYLKKLNVLIIINHSAMISKKCLKKYHRN